MKAFIRGFRIRSNKQGMVRAASVTAIPVIINADLRKQGQED